MSRKNVFAMLLVIGTYFPFYASAWFGLSRGIEQHQSNNVVALSSDANRCSGVIVGGHWVLTSADCGLSNDDAVKVTTSWLAPKGKESSPYYRTLTQDHHIAPNAGMQHSTNMLLKIESAPDVSAFNAISPVALPMLLCQHFAIQSGWGQHVYSAAPLFEDIPSEESECLAVTRDNEELELARYGLAMLMPLAADGFDTTHLLANLLPKHIMQYWHIGDFIKSYTPYNAQQFNQVRDVLGPIAGTIALQNGDAGTPYVNQYQQIVAIHHATLFKHDGVLTMAKLISSQSQWLLETINAWHYPTQVKTTKNRATITFQSLHNHPVDILNDVSVSGVDIEAIECETVHGDKVEPLIIQPYDICHMSIYNTAHAEAVIYLSADEVITVDYGRNGHNRYITQLKQLFSSRSIIF